jgi:hypothetical protein
MTDHCAFVEDPSRIFYVGWGIELRPIEQDKIFQK